MGAHPASTRLLSLEQLMLFSAASGSEWVVARFLFGRKENLS